MRSITGFFHRKNWYLKMVFGLMTIFVICLSSTTSLFAAQPVSKDSIESLEESFDPDDLLAEMTDPDNLKEDAYNQLSNLLGPEDDTFLLSQNDYNDMENAILDKLYSSWINNPSSSSYTKQKIMGWDITNIQTPEQAISIQEKIHEDGSKSICTTTFSGRPYIKVLSSGDSFIDDINVPVLPQPEGKGANIEDYIPEYTTVTKRINFGWEVGNAVIDKSKERTLVEPEPFVLGVKFKTWVKFSFKLRLFFPVEVTISHPTRIFEGQSYEFNCTVVPIDVPNFNEFEFLLEAKAGYKVSLGIWIPGEIQPFCTGTQHCSDCWLPIVGTFDCFCYRDCKGSRKEWYQFMGDEWSISQFLGKNDIPDFTDLTKSYKTPLGGDSVDIELPLKVDVLDIIGLVYKPVSIMSNFLSADIELGTAKLFGDAVKAKMSILSSTEADRDVAFTNENGETARMKFTIPDSEQTPNVEFSVTHFKYDFNRLELYPSLFLGFENWEIGKIEFMGWTLFDVTLPLYDWWKGSTYYFNKIDIPTDASIGSTFAYYSNGISVTEDYSAIYDFDMSANNWYSGYTPYGYMQRYLINLKNKNLEDGQNDLIKLSVNGLPEGYLAYFDSPFGLYRLSGATEDPFDFPSFPSWSSDFPRWAVPYVYSPFGLYGRNRGLLTILKTGEPTNAPPGSLSFDIVANSTQRVNHQLTNPAITEIETLEVPETHGVDLQLMDTLYNGVPVTPGEYFPVNLFGQNLGNVNETVNVSAQLDMGDSARTWSETFTLDPYGSTTDQYFSGDFGFTYSREDLFPNPGVHMLEITANCSRTALIDVTLRLFLNFTKAYGIESSITPLTTTIFANWAKNFTLSFNNTGNVMDNFTIETQGWDEYLSYPHRVDKIYPMSPQEITLSLNIPDPDTINPDTYQVRIIIKSEGDKELKAYSVHEINLTILSPDYVPPGIVPVGHPAEMIYPQSPLTLGPSWKAYDEYNDTYAIYINNSLYESGGWTEGEPIQAPVTGENPLDPGLYNVTITFSDKSGNIAKEQSWVYILPLDTTFPLILPLSGKTIFPINFSEPQSFYWNCTEDFIYDYQILVNNTPVTLIWQYNLCMRLYNRTNFKFNYTIHPQTLSEGTWNITFLIRDMSNNTASDTVLITIAGPDDTQPNITEAPGSSANLGNGTRIQITATDAFPDKYTFWVGTTLLSSGAWESGVTLSFSVDDIGIMVGDNAMKIEMIDLAGNIASYQWTFALSDITAPTLLTAPPNLILYEHNYTQIAYPFWSVEDLDSQPGTFTINLDGNTIVQGIWSNANGTIELPIPYLLPGMHHYDAYFRDATGNTLYSPIDLVLYDIIKPRILGTDYIRFEPLYSADWFEFYISESHPSQFSLYRDGTLVDSGSLTSGFPYLFVRITDLSTGLYNYTMVAEDESGNIGRLSIKVQVTDYTPPSIVRPSDMIISEGTLDQMIIWEIREANPQTYSLYRNGFLLESGALTDSSFNHSLAGLLVGEYIYTLIVSDALGLSHTTSSYVTVLDVTSPILSRISDCRFVKNDPNADIVWQAFDLHPLSYQFTINGEDTTIVSWDGSEITLHCTGWAEGNYTVLLKVTDSSGNVVSDEIKVEILIAEKIFTEPRISPGFGLLGIILALFFSFRISRRKKKPMV